jgi:hypothetical protein
MLKITGKDYMIKENVNQSSVSVNCIRRFFCEFGDLYFFKIVDYTSIEHL